MKPSRHCRPILVRAAGALLVLALLVPLAAQGGRVSVADEWDRAGYVSLDNGAVAVVFARENGWVSLYDSTMPAGGELARVVPIGMDDATATAIAFCDVVRGPGRGMQCRVAFGTPNGPIEAMIGLTDSGAIRVQPGRNLFGLSVQAQYAYGVLPSRHLDDNIYRPGSYSDLAQLHIPSENLFMGLMEGGNRILACAWPPGEQSARLRLRGANEQRRIRAFELAMAGREAFIGLFSAPGIWHEVPLDPSYQGQDVELQWEPPFQAQWKIQLSELGVPTTFRGLRERIRRWRPSIGWYIYPFFQEGGRAILHLHKKLEAEGSALVYALEGHSKTPYSLMTENLAFEDQRDIIELQPVENYYVLDPNPVPGGFVMDAHCYGRDQLKLTTLAVGAQSREVPFLHTHIGDREHECKVILKYGVRRSLETMAALDQRIGEWLKQEAGNPAVVAFLQRMRQTLSGMQQEYTNRLGGKTPEQIAGNVEQWAERFRHTIRQDAGLELCPELLHYINELNAIISMDEDQTRRFGTWGRKLYQQAGYECVGSPEAAVYAERIRGVLRRHMRLRHYETVRPSGRPESLLPNR